MADVGVPQYRRCTKGQGLLRKEGPPICPILLRNLVLSRFTRFLKGHHRAFYESHPALGVFSTKVSLLLKGFQQKSACFRRNLQICKYAFYESSEGFCCSARKPANPCHPNHDHYPDHGGCCDMIRNGKGKLLSPPKLGWMIVDYKVNFPKFLGWRGIDFFFTSEQTHLAAILI